MEYYAQLLPGTPGTATNPGKPSEPSDGAPLFPSVNLSDKTRWNIILGMGGLLFGLAIANVVKSFKDKEKKATKKQTKLEAKDPYAKYKI